MNSTDAIPSTSKKIKLDLLDVSTADFVRQSTFIWEVKLILLTLLQEKSSKSLQVRSKYWKKNTKLVFYVKCTLNDGNEQNFLPFVSLNCIDLNQLIQFYFLYKVLGLLQTFVILTNKIIINTTELRNTGIKVLTHEVDNCKYHSFKYQANKESLKVHTRSQDSICELKKCLKNIVIREYPFNNEKEIKDYIKNKKGMGECFNFIDVSLAQEISHRLLEYDFSSINSVENFLNEIKMKISKNFVGNIFSNLLQPLMWYGCDSNIRTTYYIGKLMTSRLGITEELIQSENSRELFIRLFTQRRFGLFSILLKGLVDKDTKKILLNDVHNIVGCPIKFISNGTVDTDELRREITTVLIHELYEDKSRFSQLNDILIGSLRHKHYKTFKYFMENYSGDFLQVFKLCIKNKIVSGLSYLVENHMAMIEVDGNTALHIAYQERASFEVIQSVTNQENINARNMLGETPLYVAIISGLTADKEILNYLIDQGAILKYKFD